MMRGWRLWLGAGLLACTGASEAPGPEPNAASAAPAATERAGLPPPPKPGERVRQPELDAYCMQPERGAAFYYHGGAPVVRVARKDGCAPLYLTECEDQGRCYPPRDQEPGMWCCAAPEQAAARAER